MHLCWTWKVQSEKNIVDKKEITAIAVHTKCHVWLYVLHYNNSIHINALSLVCELNFIHILDRFLTREYTKCSINWLWLVLCTNPCFFSSLQILVRFWIAIYAPLLPILFVIFQSSLTSSRAAWTEPREKKYLGKKSFVRSFPIDEIESTNRIFVLSIYASASQNKLKKKIQGQDQIICRRNKQTKKNSNWFVLKRLIAKKPKMRFDNLNIV